jgi:hypothetical protein
MVFVGYAVGCAEGLVQASALLFLLFLSPEPFRIQSLHKNNDEPDRGGIFCFFLCQELNPDKILFYWTWLHWHPLTVNVCLDIIRFIVSWVFSIKLQMFFMLLDINF